MLSHPDPTKTIPEILELAEHVDLPGLSKEQVIDLKLDANNEPALYRLLLLAQCHALHSAMPFLFEGIDDETELVLPENLLHSDSIVRKLVAASNGRIGGKLKSLAGYTSTTSRKGKMRSLAA